MPSKDRRFSSQRSLCTTSSAYSVRSVCSVCSISRLCLSHGPPKTGSHGPGLQLNFLEAGIGFLHWKVLNSMIDMIAHMSKGWVEAVGRSNFTRNMFKNPMNLTERCREMVRSCKALGCRPPEVQSLLEHLRRAS